jgi:hypothetical protein
VRAAIDDVGREELSAAPQAGDRPPWAVAELPGEVVDLLNELLATPTWNRAAALLREQRAAVLFADQARPARVALAALYADNERLLDLLSILDSADDQGLEPVLEELCAAEEHGALLRAWLNTPTWTASRQFLSHHPGLLGAERTQATLAAGSGDPVIRRHLAIARLAATMSLDEVYDIVLDPSDAAAAVLDAVSRGDMDMVAEIWHAAPHLGDVQFTGKYVASILIAADGDPDGARQLIGEAASEASESARLARSCCSSL